MTDNPNSINSTAGSIQPQAAAELVQSLENGTRGTVCIHGPRGSGKTTSLARFALAAFDRGTPLAQIAAYAPTHLAIRYLRAIVGKRWPDVDPQGDLFSHELSGIPLEAMRTHTALPGDNKPFPLKAIMRAYLDALAGVNGITAPYSETDWKFLDGLKPRLEAAITADLEARLQGEPLPRNAYLQSVADFVAQYKAENDILDLADLLNGDFYASPQIRLVLLDELDGKDQALLTRFFPNAHVISTSLSPQPADVVIHLPQCLRKPERMEISDPKPTPQLVPPPRTGFGSLFIVAPPWCKGAWFAWLSGHGIPPPAGLPHWRAIVEAWRYDQGGYVQARAIKPLLVSSDLPTFDDYLIGPGEIPGWLNWRDHAARFDAWTLAHAEAVLKRYGRLNRLPPVRYESTAARLRGVEADVVIADVAAWITDDARETTLTRATKQLIVLQKG